MKKVNEVQIDQARRALPLPDLLRKLGFPPPASGEGAMRSPFAPGVPLRSFVISKNGDSWEWEDQRGGHECKGEEVAFLARLEGLETADAIFRYVDLTEVAGEAGTVASARKPKGQGVENDAKQPFTDQVEKLNELAREHGIGVAGAEKGGDSETITERKKKAGDGGHSKTRAARSGKKGSGAGAAKTGGDSGNDAPRFDPRKVCERMGLYWLNGSPSYFLLKEENGRKRFLEMGAAEVRRKLRVQGFRTKADADAGESVSQIDRILDEATETRAIDFACSIAGTAAGVYETAGSRILVRESPRLIEPKLGEFPVIEAFLNALLGDASIHFCCWLKVAFQALRAGERRPGQALILVGPPDCGKSRIQHQIITPILAGRSADPKSYFFGTTDFNSELIGSEHLLIEEVPSSSRHEERQFFGERIKEIVANDTARLHKKGRDAVTVSPFRRLSISINSNPEKLRCLPPLTDDLKEKIIVLVVKQAMDFWQQFAGEMDPRRAFREAIDCELPAFVNYLLEMQIPVRMESRRYGVDSLLPTEIALTIFESEPEHHLLLMIDKEIFGDGTTQAGEWRGDAEDLKQELCAEGSSVRSSAIKSLSHPSVCGQLLARLADRMPERFEKAQRTAHKRCWVIQPPQ